jgi:hypothetical protein
MPADLRQAFEMGYLAAAARARREVPAAWRDAVVNSLTGELSDREQVAVQAGEDRRYASHLRALRLVILRCEAASTLLSWRKEIPEKSRGQLREALGKLVAEARRLGAA